MRRLASLALAALLAAATPLHAGETDGLAAIAAQIGQHPVVRAEFTQSKQMAALKRPLVTSGRLVFSRQHGVLWQIEKPYRMTYVLAEESIVEIGPDGVRKPRGLREVPGLAQVGRVFRALLGANTAALGEYFEVGLQGDRARWQIDLKPRQAQLAQYLSGLQLRGGRFVESIRIGEAGGDTTEIRFREVQGLAAPSEAELQLLGNERAGK